MIRRLAPALLLLPSAGLPSLASAPSIGHAATSTSTCSIDGALFAVPSAIHSGDTVYLSGGCLSPYTEYTITQACPSRLDRDAFTSIEGSTRTGRRGQFVRFTMHAPALSAIPSSSCTVYASVPGSALGPELPAIYSILSPGQQITSVRCNVQLCGLRISAGEKTVRAGGSEAITIQGGWPGATSTVSVSYGGTSLTTSQRLTLDWQGSGRAHIGVPTQSLPLSCNQVQIRVSIHLGNRLHYAGSARTCFAVTR
jgi:hypothetical protein